MRHRIAQEWAWLRELFRDPSPPARASKRSGRRAGWQAVAVLLFSVAFVLLQVQLGSRRDFRGWFGDAVSPEGLELWSWGWWFGVQGVTGFVLPVLVLVLLFRRRPSEIGLGLGDWKLATTVSAVYLVLVVVGTWVLSDGADFQAEYPRLPDALVSWRVFWTYHLLFLFYWLGWEYLWRGFVLFGTAPALGPVLAVVAQTVPFAILHADKPVAEAWLSIAGGVGLGLLVWRCRSFWIAVPLHAAQMVLIDLFCTLRQRTGAEGLGPDALAQALAGLFQ